MARIRHNVKLTDYCVEMLKDYVRSEIDIAKQQMRIAYNDGKEDINWEHNLESLVEGQNAVAHSIAQVMIYLSLKEDIYDIYDRLKDDNSFVEELKKIKGTNND